MVFSRKSVSDATDLSHHKNDGQGLCWFCKLAISPVSASGQTPSAECAHLSFSLQRGIEFTMLLTVVILKSLIELSLMFIVGRFLLGLLAGAKRHTNVFWQMLDVAAKPCLWLTRKVSPRLVLDQHIPLAAASWLVMAWVLVVKLKIDLCLELGAQACQ